LSATARDIATACDIATARDIAAACDVVAAFGLRNFEKLKIGLRKKD